MEQQQQQQNIKPIALEDRLIAELKEEFSHNPNSVRGFQEEEYPELRKGVDHVLSSLAKYPVECDKQTYTRSRRSP